MTDSLPDPELDELIAAYLDGEATVDERARVQGDPTLLARVEELRVVARLVAEPVAAPEAAVRDAHIAAALDASSTSSVVTAMPISRRRADLMRAVSVAAVLVAILVAVPLILSNGGSDDDTVATDAIGADDELAETDAAEREGADGAAAMAVEDESADDGETASAEMAPADAPTTGNDGTEEESAGDEGDLGASADDGVLAGVARIDLDPVASPQVLRRRIERRLAAESDAAADAGTTIDDLVCVPVIADEIAARGPADAIGVTTIDGVISEYVLLSEPMSALVVFDVATCTPRDVG